MTKKKNENGNGNGTAHTQEKEPVLKIIKARSQNQKEYPLHISIDENVRPYLPMIIGQVDDNNIIIFCTGPSGTGKTLLACYVAARDLLDKKIDKIILTRPIVEAGESLGYLPGDVAEKVDPYIRPLIDCLEKVIPKAMIKFFTYSLNLSSSSKKTFAGIPPITHTPGMAFLNSEILIFPVGGGDTDSIQSATTSMIGCVKFFRCPHA